MASLRQLLKSGAYWRKKLKSGPSFDGAHESGPYVIHPNVDRILSCEFGEVSDACRQATVEVLELLRPSGYENLARHSPGLNGFAWESYISLSVLRLARGQSIEGECASEWQGSGFRLLLRQRGVVGQEAWI